MADTPETPTPRNAGEAAQLALDWATGRRSWTNTYAGSHGPEVVAAMDTSEVEKWCAVAVMYAEMDAAAISTQQSYELMDHQRARP